MTSNGEAVLNPSSISAATLNDATPRPDSKPASPSPREKPAPKEHVQNGEDAADDAQNESEAETVVLDPKDDRGDRKVIKTENNDEDDAARLRSVKEDSRTRSPTTNGRRPSRDDKVVKVNGAKHGSERDVKSPVPTSPSSRTASRHTKETSPADSVRSPAPSAASPPQPAGRGRSASTVESRKRKLRDESNPKALEPPRQKAKTEGLKDLRQPTSPATPGLGRPHKRSQSTQSIVSGAVGRKRRELAALALPERKNWSDDSSENSSSPRPTTTPNLPHTRLKRSSHRALTSPARAMPHGRKVDRFGATRLARESEKGDLASVKAAHEAAPEELDQEDFAGIAPLQKAALHGWADVVRYLIQSGCRTDCESNDRDTPLIDAVENGHLDVVKLLLNEGHVNPHHQNKKGQRAIDVLDYETEDAEEIEKELRAAMRREVDTTANDDYSQSGVSQTKSASRLLYNEYNTETLIEKAGDGDILAVGELINSNIKPNIACGVAAARGGHYDILSILLASGLKADPDPSKHSETPMLVAIGRGHLKIVQLLLEQDNFDPTRRNREGKAYWEISEDRRGPKWEHERDILKSAYDSFKTSHKSPRRNKKEAPNPSAIRMKRKSSPLRRERSSSPRPEAKRANFTKSTTVPQGPQKSRRLMSGKEMANREGKRRRRVVNDESSDSDSDDAVRAPAKRAIKPRSFSEGEDHKAGKKIKARSGEKDVSKRRARAQSHASDDEPQQKPVSKIRTKMEKVHSAKPTPDPESPDEKKPIKNRIRPRSMEGPKAKKRRASNDTIDVRVKKTPSASAKSTPAPPEKASTPDSVRERRQEEQRQAEEQAAEAKRKAAEEAARKREEEEAARRREEEAARKAAEEEARRKAEAEAEAKRLAEEAEAARRREEEEARRRAEEEARRQEELAARQQRVSMLPRALRRACELGNNRPLHFSGEELGISAVFLPLFYATSHDLRPDEPKDAVSKIYIPSFQVVGILGLPELDLARLDVPYSSWDRVAVTSQQRDLLLRQYDVALLAQDFRFPMEGTPDFDYAKIQESIKEARQQFLNMDGLYWVEDVVLYPEVEKVENLRPLLEEIKDVSRRRRIHVAETEAETMPEKKHRPRKSFMDTVLAQNLVNGIAAKVNGEG
ncbi:hypothetical protein BU26DRAFT_519555 [Trematosphaeria pertusa]|uniref:Uncharacterized protein n=1 Tax=Trematosphaeria pertusa TaxID=390896 RepID=A0A6A6IGH8_9PLEO|nr:uncharacterized protein BU26DRAFT_519555 [Trematosphaeria pertusa]KAF2249511.1 hypothetical protein BU26DRAFT_519555 [Trematosphaeria pertusa]